MVEELLEFSRIEDGRFTLSIEPMDIKAELEDAVYTYQEFLAAGGHRRLPHRLRGGVRRPSPATPTGCARSSAISWTTPPSTAAPASASTPPSTQDDGDVVITVRDYGPGIPLDELPNVKYKFYNGSSTARGSGIGLAVCEEIISRHNGELTISNADDEAGGCLVEIRLPTGT